jgi:hypothetical protein
MNCYDELPVDYHDCWVQNLAYSLWHYTSITKIFEKVDNVIIMYKITAQGYNGIVKYNIPRHNYEVVFITTNIIESIFFSRFQDVLDYLWELDKPNGTEELNIFNSWY